MLLEHSFAYTVHNLSGSPFPDHTVLVVSFQWLYQFVRATLSIRVQSSQIGNAQM